jgi:hypothetical protein
MADGKKPSIYQDRGTIGSAKELDEYGVWVKSEPQDLAGGDKTTEAEDFSLDNLPDFSPGLEIPPGEDSGGDFSIPEDDFSIAGAEETGAGETAGFQDGLGDLPDFPAGDFSISEEENGEALSFGADESLELPPAEEDSLPSLSLDGEDLDFSLPEEVPAEETQAEEDSLPSLSLDGEDMDFSLPGEAPAEESPAEETQEESPETEEGDGFDEISLEDLLGEVADEIPGENPAEAEGESPGAEEDKSTQLLMKIAGELSSIREELRALKQEFSSVRGTEAERPESRGFFDDAGKDDKIALTGDELDNIINTADFTEETGANAAEGEFLPELAEEAAPETALEELSLDVLDDPFLPGETEAQESPEAAAEAPDAGLELGELADAGQAGELGQIEGLGELEDGDDLELPMADLSDADITGDLSLASAGEESPAGDSVVILEESPAGEGEAEEPDISLDTSFSEEESIALESFDEDALDLSSAVIDEPDLGAEIMENPVLEPALEDIGGMEDGEGEFSLEEEIPPEGEGAVEILEENSIVPAESAGAEEGAGSRGGGEELDQIIPEGFMVEELDDEGEAGFGGLDSLEEIPEDLPPEEGEVLEEALEAPEKREASALPGDFKTELKQILSYMDQLLESLPEEKIEEFAKSEYFDTYKKLFQELGLA